MCGIYGIVSPTVEPDPAATRRAMDSLSAFVESLDPGRLSGGSARSLLDTLPAVLEASHRLVGGPAFLAVAEDAGVRDRLAELLCRLRDGVQRLERAAEQGSGGGQRAAEVLNQLITGGRDVAWRIDLDVLRNVERAGRLLGGEETSRPSAWSHAWQLNLALNSLDRLEVRGRDSAGIAVYVRFPSEAALDGFLRSPGAEVPAGDVEARSRITALSHGAIIRPGRNRSVLLFAFKVAEEVGELGANVRFLRAAITGDRVFQAALRQPLLGIQLLAHTRWASNGVISLPNCHPVDSTVTRHGIPVEGSAGAIVAVLNGDIDNYQELLRRYVIEPGLEIDRGITTDAKIIPIVVDRHYRLCGILEEAFRRAFDEFEGSMAIGLMAADHGDEFLFAQKGSGQGLFFGLADGAVAVASEMYGLVELTPHYLKAEGERKQGGETYRVTAPKGVPDVALVTAAGAGGVAPEKIRCAEITTRDINRAGYPRFLLKEISESVDSVKKTLRGRFDLDEEGVPHFRLGPEVLPPGLLQGLRDGSVRTLLAIGQGTAAIAAEGVAWLLRRALAGSPHPIEISAGKATEISGHAMRDDMSDTAVIAVSQSGTTTDTNRTVDLLKQRGAWVLAIVNRRNSDLVYKAHGVLYTSDGRDIEMSVASTKAFYSQNVAGAVLALALAENLGTMPAGKLAAEAAALNALPDAMRATLALGPAVEGLAERHALRHTHWAVVGSGPGKIAADEIRIKLSELCYKSIASDFLEDKKHIDLSSEPLVLVCACGAPAPTISDLVKEVAIFKAHRSVPLVIADAGETRFDPYAAGIVPVPRYDGALSYLLATMAGHLFGYHAAASFDRQASALRSIRASLAAALDRRAVGGLPADGSLVSGYDLPAELVEEIAGFNARLEDGALDSGLRSGTAVRLAALFRYLLGRMSEDDLARELKVSQLGEDIATLAVRVVTSAINELARPIDAIKHQAKTITVGISRLEEAPAEGPLWAQLRALDIPLEELTATHRTFLRAFEKIVSEVQGVTLYRVAGLDAVGRPRPESTIRAVKKTGIAAGIASRSERASPLAGTKWGVVKSRDVYVGYGQNDQRRIVIVPIVGEKPEGYLALFHVATVFQGQRSVRLQALAARPARLEQLRIAVTERSMPWDDSLIDAIDNDTLFFRSPEFAAEEILRNGEREAEGAL